MIPLAAWTSCTPLSNVSSCCIAAFAEELESPSSVAIPEGGTVAGNVWTPVQNNWQLLVAVTGGKIAPEFCDRSRSVIRPPQPELPVPDGIPVCHWLL